MLRPVLRSWRDACRRKAGRAKRCSAGSSCHRRGLRSASRCAVSRRPASTSPTAWSADLEKLCGASGVGADIESRELPLSAGLCSVAGLEARLAFALGGGDDYELLFTAAPDDRVRIAALDAGVVLRRIGAVSEAAGVRVDGAPPERDAGHGFDHFADRGRGPR